MYYYNGQVLKVHDGDTLKVRLDLGFSIFFEEWLRLDGLNAPELGTVTNPSQLAEDSTLALINMLGPREWFAPIRTRVKFGRLGDYIALAPPRILVETRLKDPSDTDKYGRILGQVTAYTSDGIPDNQTVNRRMIDGGFAQARSYSLVRPEESEDF